jgi:hypothetical protein
VAAVAELGSRLHYAHRVSEALYNAIAARYGFAIPDEYRRLESRGLFTLSAAAHASTFYRPDSYLWLHDMEWYSPQAILDFEFEPYHLPGFVPFAFTGGGDYWCWHPAHADRRGAHVLCCCHDCELATIYAPNFHTALYRQILDFCVGSSEDEDIDSSAFLHRWATDLAVIFPDSWCARLRQLADDPQRSEHASGIERADISFDLMGTEIPWMQQTA